MKGHFISYILYYKLLGISSTIKMLLRINVIQELCGWLRLIEGCAGLVSRKQYLTDIACCLWRPVSGVPNFKATWCAPVFCIVQHQRVV
jgi:hypothetical protein